MRIAVCDDDDQELARLSKLIEDYQSCRGERFDCRYFRNGTDFLCEFEGGKYDLVFLDVLMPGPNGIETAQELREIDKNVRLIFVSSSREFALESYAVEAYHYLLKPVDSDSLFPLLDRLQGELSASPGQGFVLKDRRRVVYISFSELEYVEVINKTVSFHLTDGSIRQVNAALAEVEETLLSRPEFIKTHRSYLVNLRHVRNITTSCVETKNGHAIPISRKRHNAVQDAYLQFLFQYETRIAEAPKTEGTQNKQSEGPWRILLVDDDAADRGYWADVLRSHGCVVSPAGNGEEALALAKERPWDCVLLDVKIPGEDGFTLCGRLRQHISAPIVFLSCLTEPDKQMQGFSVGGIDYITKDTPAELFWTKLQTRIRLAASDRTQLSFGPLLLDLSGHKASVDGKELQLAPIEFDLLCQLSEHADHVFTPEEIFDSLWGGQLWDGGQTVQVHMSRLRRKLEKAWGAHRFIETVWGQGYRFVPPKP